MGNKRNAAARKKGYLSKKKQFKRRFRVKGKFVKAVSVPSSGFAEPKDQTMTLIAVTRIHAANSSSLPSLESITRFINNTKLYADEIVIALGANSLKELQSYSEEITSLLDQLQPSIPVHIHPIYPWGYFTSALNQSITLVQDRKAEFVAFQVCFSVLHSLSFYWI